MKDATLIIKLGGAKAVADEIGEHPNVVWNWCRRGISKAGRYQIRDLAKRKKVALPPGFIPEVPNL